MHNVLSQIMLATSNEDLAAGIPVAAVGVRFGLAPSVVGLDPGYNNWALCHGLVERGIDGVFEQCKRSRSHQKVLVRHVREDNLERINANRPTDWRRAVDVRRRQTVERSFANTKPLHGHRHARFRGRRRVQGQCLQAAAACQNIKKIANGLLLPLYRVLQDVSGAATAVLRVRNTPFRWFAGIPERAKHSLRTKGPGHMTGIGQQSDGSL